MVITVMVDFLEYVNFHTLSKYKFVRFSFWLADNLEVVYTKLHCFCKQYGLNEYFKGERKIFSDRLILIFKIRISLCQDKTRPNVG